MKAIPPLLDDISGRPTSKCAHGPVQTNIEHQVGVVPVLCNSEKVSLHSAQKQKYPLITATMHHDIIFFPEHIKNKSHIQKGSVISKSYSLKMEYNKKSHSVGKTRERITR